MLPLQHSSLLTTALCPNCTPVNIALCHNATPFPPVTTLLAFRTTYHSTSLIMFLYPTTSTNIIKPLDSPPPSHLPTSRTPSTRAYQEIAFKSLYHCTEVDVVLKEMPVSSGAGDSCYSG